MSDSSKELAEHHEYEKFAEEIRGILESLGQDEPVGDAIRREARYVLDEVEKLHRKFHPHLLEDAS